MDLMNHDKDSEFETRLGNPCVFLFVTLVDLVTRANPRHCSFSRLFETTPRAGNILKEDFATAEQRNREHLS